MSASITNKPAVLRYVAGSAGDLRFTSRPDWVTQATTIVAGNILDALDLTYKTGRGRGGGQRWLACSTELALSVLAELPAAMFVYEPGRAWAEFAVYEVVYDPHPQPLTGCQFSRAAVVQLSKATVFVVRHSLTGAVSLAFGGRLVGLREG